MLLASVPWTASKMGLAVDTHSSKLGSICRVVLLASVVLLSSAGSAAGQEFETESVDQERILVLFVDSLAVQDFQASNTNLVAKDVGVVVADYRLTMSQDFSEYASVTVLPGVASSGQAPQNSVKIGCGSGTRTTQIASEVKAWFDSAAIAAAIACDEQEVIDLVAASVLSRQPPEVAIGAEGILVLHSDILEVASVSLVVDQRMQPLLWCGDLSAKPGVARALFDDDRRDPGFRVRTRTAMEMPGAVTFNLPIRMGDRSLVGSASWGTAEPQACAQQNLADRLRSSRRYIIAVGLIAMLGIVGLLALRRTRKLVPTVVNPVPMPTPDRSGDSEKLPDDKRGGGRSVSTLNQYVLNATLTVVPVEHAGNTNLNGLRVTPTMQLSLMGEPWFSQRSPVGAMNSRGFGRARAWWGDQAGALLGGFYVEKLAGQGEDAEPIVVYRSPSDPLLLAVFDGMGGAGAAKATSSPHGDRNHAYLGSRLARGVTEYWFEDVNEFEQAESLAPSLVEHLRSWHRSGLKSIEPSESLIESTLKKTLPTTLCAAVARHDGNSLVVDALWAGDSRVYLITPAEGLQQVTRDHCRQSDILGQLINDSPMNNQINAEASFYIDHHQTVTKLPALLLCCTDGVHGYVPTPGALEDVILSTLMEARSIEEWLSAMTERVVGYTSDDATLAIAALGFPSFGDLQHQFKTRREAIQHSQVDPFLRLTPDDRDGFVAARSLAWSSIRDTYEALLASRPPDRRGRQ